MGTSTSAPPPAPATWTPASAPPAPPPPARKGGLSKGAGIAIAVVVVIVVVLLALLLTGVIPGFKSSSSGGGSSPGGSGAPLSYSQARGIADSAIAAHATSPILVVGFGLDTVSEYTNSSLSPGGMCAPSGGSTSTLTVPTYTGNYHSGVAPAWIFGYYVNVSGGTLYLMGVLNGAAVYFGSESGSSCLGGTPFGNVTIPSGVIDSSAAASAAASDANSFTTANPTANAFYWLVGGFSFSTGPPLNYTFTQPATWSVFYSTCTPSQTSGTGTQFNATVNAVTSVVMGYGTQTVNCTGSIGQVVTGAEHAVSEPTPSVASTPDMTLRVV
jgi:hypothetical protein